LTTKTTMSETTGTTIARTAATSRVAVASTAALHPEPSTRAAVSAQLNHPRGKTVKLYRIVIYRGDGVFWEWSGSKGAAEARAAEIVADDAAENTEVVRVDVPEQKAALIEWLNHNAPDHNG
jgi:hypothetical protein